ncbi:hypothetical protein [Alistipes putredinis]|uniref:hypothetical protein n=1 Tax=Alistipes putredinis TaxID=28117 RepID=UPI003AB35FAE
MDTPKPQQQPQPQRQPQPRQPQIDCRRCTRYYFCRIAAVIPTLTDLFDIEHCNAYEERTVR